MNSPAPCPRTLLLNIGPAGKLHGLMLLEKEKARKRTHASGPFFKWLFRKPSRFTPPLPAPLPPNASGESVP